MLQKIQLCYCKINFLTVKLGRKIMSYLMRLLKSFPEVVRNNTIWCCCCTDTLKQLLLTVFNKISLEDHGATT